MISIDVTGLQELITECERLSTPKELEDVNKKALKRCGDIAKNEVVKAMPKSKDVSKSGRKGSRTYKHSSDNIPIKLTKKGGKMLIIVGWERGDNSPYFYAKFIEFGTSKQPPQAPFKKVFINQRLEYDLIFLEEYKKKLEKLGK